MESYLPKVDSLCIAQILSATTKTVTFLEAYKNFKDVFSMKNAGHLPLNKNHNQAIDLVDGKQSLYESIYNLSENKFSIL